MQVSNSPLTQVWYDSSCLDEFRASQDYAVFLVALGTLDLDESPPSSSASLSSSSSSLLSSSAAPTIQTVKFPGRSATNGLYLRGWRSFYTVAFPLVDPVVTDDAERDQSFRRLEGPRYPTLSEKGGDMEWYVRLVNLAVSMQPQGLQYGWGWEVRTIRIPGTGEGGATDPVK
jgi:hypothetical protein